MFGQLLPNTNGMLQCATVSTEIRRRQLWPQLNEALADLSRLPTPKPKRETIGQPKGACTAGLQQPFSPAMVVPPTASASTSSTTTPNCWFQ